MIIFPGSGELDPKINPISGQTALIQLLKESHLFQQPDFIKLSISKAFQINTDSKLTLLENLYVLTDDSCPDDLGRSILSGNIRNTIIDEGKGSKRHKYLLEFRRANLRVPPWKIYVQEP